MDIEKEFDCVAIFPLSLENKEVQISFSFAHDFYHFVLNGLP